MGAGQGVNYEVIVNVSGVWNAVSVNHAFSYEGSLLLFIFLQFNISFSSYFDKRDISADHWWYYHN